MDRAIQKAKQEIMSQEDDLIFKALESAGNSIFEIVHTYKDNE